MLVESCSPTTPRESSALSLRPYSDGTKGCKSCALTSALRKAAKRRVESRSPKDTRESLARRVRSCMMEMPTSSCCSSLSSWSISRRHCPSTRSSWQVRWCRNWTALQGEDRLGCKGSLGLSFSVVSFWADTARLIQAQNSLGPIMGGPAGAPMQEPLGSAAGRHSLQAQPCRCTGVRNEWLCSRDRRRWEQGPANMLMQSWVALPRWGAQPHLNKLGARPKEDTML